MDYPIMQCPDFCMMCVFDVCIFDEACVGMYECMNV
jgi:hypothetical protein